MYSGVQVNVSVYARMYRRRKGKGACLSVAAKNEGKSLGKLGEMEIAWY